MSDKPQHASGAFFAIPGTSLVSMEGPDASAFAQAQFMNDVSALQPGHWHWNGWLTPKGRLRVLFALVKQGEGSLLLLLLDAPPEDMVSQLQRFVFRSKVAIRVRDDLSASGCLQRPSQASGGRCAALGDGSLELDLGGVDLPRTLRIGAAAGADGDAAAEWLRIDMAHGLPRLPPAHLEQWTPQQLSLDRLKAYSVRKGCYPGQEIVARTHFLGQAKRGLVRLRGESTALLGEVSADGAQPVGRMVCAIAGEGLAVLPVDAGDGPFASAGQPLLRLPLLEGLAR